MSGNGSKVRSGQVAHRRNGTTTITTGWDTLGQEFLTVWQLAHGAPQGAVSVMVVQNGLMVLIENAFSQAELALAQQSKDNLLQQYINSLTRQILPLLTTRVERIMGQQMGTTSITPNMKQNWMMVFFKFDEPTSSEGQP